MNQKVNLIKKEKNFSQQGKGSSKMPKEFVLEKYKVNSPKQWKKIHTGVKNMKMKEEYVTFSYITNKWSCLHNTEILFI